MESADICDRRFLPGTGPLASNPICSVHAHFCTLARLPLADNVRNAPGLICQGCARSVAIPGPPPPWFFVSAASHGLRDCVSGLESTLAAISISVDSQIAWVLHTNTLFWLNNLH